MRLLCVIDSLGSGGAQRQITAIASNMKKLGWEVAVAWYTDSDFYRQKLKDAGIICFQNIKAVTFCRRLIFLRETMQKFRPDSVLAFLPTPAFLCSLIKIMTFARWKLVVSIRGNNEGRFMNIRNRLYRLGYKVASFVVCNSYAEAEVWDKYASNFHSMLKVIPNFVQIEQMGMQSQVRTQIDGRIHILVAANLCSNIKNPENVVKALSLLSKEEQKKIVIDWYGNRYQNGKLSVLCQSIEKLIRDLGVESSFRTHDAISNIYSEMCKSDIVGLFSTEEGMPNVICEAMLLGKPVIMTKVSDWEMLVKDNGVVCEGTDAESIRKVFHTILNYSNDKLCKMGEISREIGQSIFDETKTTDDWWTVLWNKSN